MKKLYKGISTGFVRKRSVENVITELIEAKRKWNFRAVTIEDEIFPINRKWIMEFCHE